MSLDYAPEREKVAGDVVCGTIFAEFGNRTNSVRGAIERRLTLGGGTMAAHRHELLLPPDAPDLLLDRENLVSHYERSLLPNQRELLVIFTMRFERDGSLHAQWELARSFVRQHIVGRRLGTVLVQHCPGLAGYADGKPHVHALAIARELIGSNFAAFTPLSRPGAKAILAAEWQAWQAAHC
ncbi:hypothetical protein [Croceibacterium ferulae]|uniref:hypothetical protein n=1 Tax=Croceibacterium ferulae TaxID=1854641 RepID=UPI000EACDFF5|nr:hypothetical protein [Croceibacterium ferulae]